MKKRREIKGKSLTTPGMSISLRDIIDRSAKGLPINTAMREHKPLPPDGEDEEDFESGTRQYLDLNDVHQLQQEIEQAQEEAEKNKRDEDKRKKEEEFSNAVDAEIKRREEEKRLQALNGVST